MNPFANPYWRKSGRGVTAFKAQGGYTEVEQVVLYCVVTRLELTKLESIVRS